MHHTASGIQHEYDHVSTQPRVSLWFDTFPHLAAGAAPTSADGFVSERAMRPPKWLRRPCGVSFGFGGTLARFNEKSVALTRVVTDHDVVARSRELQAALESRELTSYCATKAANSASERDAAEWSLLQVLCSQEQRLLLLQYLGLAEEPTEAPPPPPQALAAAEPPQATSAGGGGFGGGGLGGEEDDPAAIFSQLAVAQEEKEAVAAAQAADAAAKAEAAAQAQAEAEAHGAGGQDGTPTTPRPQGGTSPDLEQRLSRAMLNGNFDTAVACCLEAGRVADALVLAASGGPELWTQTRDAYLSSSASPFMATLSAVVHQDFGRAPPCFERAPRVQLASVTASRTRAPCTASA